MVSKYIGPHGYGDVNHLVALSKGLMKRGIDVLVVASSDNGSSKFRVYRGVPYFSVPSIDLPQIYQRVALGSVSMLLRLIKWFNPDIVHIQGRIPPISVAAALALRLTEVGGAFLTVHGTRMYAGQSLVQRIVDEYDHKISKYTISSVDRAIAVSSAVKSYVKTLTGKDAVVIPNGVDIKRFNIKGDARFRTEIGVKDEVLVAYIGRIYRAKGVFLLLEAFKKVKAENVKLVYIGDGPHLDDLIRKAKKLNLKKRVLFTGYRTDIPEILGSLDIVVIPSYSDGFCLSIAEAMASGKPVVATRIGGIPELVGEAGILINPGSVDTLAEAITILVDDKELRFKMGLEGRRRIKERYTTRRMVDDTVRLYMETCSR